MDKKLKIAIIGSRGYPYVYSGYETLVKELSERLVKRGHNVSIYCHRSLFKQRPKIVNGINLIYTPSIESKYLSQIINSFFSFLHVIQSGADIVFVLNCANGPFGFLTKIFRKKTCINVDGLEWLRPKWKGIGSAYFRFSSRLATIFFDYIITDSYEMNKIYKEKYNKESEVIAYGSTMLHNSDDDLCEYKLSKDSYYLVVGRLIPDNNSLSIIEGFLNSKSKKKLVIVGDVPYKDKYADKVRIYQSNKILFTGYINSQAKLSKLYNNCYGYVHGHEFGGTNPTMINALDLNCEILALDTQFNREMLKNKFAILFKKDIISIVNSFKLFEKKRDLNMLKNKNYTIPVKYKWDFIVDNYISLFQKIITQKSG